MSNAAIIGILVLIVIAVAWCLHDFFASAQQFIAPDNADRDAINREHGEGTPEAQAALEERFGAGSHWLDMRTGLAGLLGMAVLIWIWLG